MKSILNMKHWSSGLWHLKIKTSLTDTDRTWSFLFIQFLNSEVFFKNIFKSWSQTQRRDDRKLKRKKRRRGKGPQTGLDWLPPSDRVFFSDCLNYQALGVKTIQYFTRKKSNRKIGKSISWPDSQVVTIFFNILDTACKRLHATGDL